MSDRKADSAWSNDKLNRQKDGKHVIKLLRERYASRAYSGETASYILNLDAPWGEGKTFFIKAVSEDLKTQGHLVAHVNAWQDDLSSDPLTTVMAAINFAIAPHISDDSLASKAFKKAKHQLGIVAAEASKQMAMHAVKALTGISISKIASELEQGSGTELPDSYEKGFSEAGQTVAEKAVEKAADALIEERLALHQQSNNSVIRFRNRLAETLKAIETEKKIPTPLFVFVDELDRCRPLYAIKLLEEMKHLFEIDGVVFIVSTDSDQLSHSIKAVYGNEFDARKYLRKFFDRTYVFPSVNRKYFIDHIFASRGLELDQIFWNAPNRSPSMVINSWAEHFSLSQRDLIQCADIIITAHTSWSYGVKFEPIRFLAMVWAIFTGRLKCASAVENGINESECPEIAGWKISYTTLDRQSGGYTTASYIAKNLINSFNSFYKKPLLDAFNQHDDDNWRDFFNNEYSIIYQSKNVLMPDGQKSVAVYYKSMIVAADHSVTS